MIFYFENTRKLCFNKNREIIIEKLKSIDVSILTPIEAINILYELVKYCD